MSIALKTAPINRLRDAHLELNPVTAVLERATLLEAYARNYSPGSDSAPQTLFATTSSGHLAPDGTLTAHKLIENAIDIYHIWKNPSFTGDAGGVSVVISFCVKAGERTKIFVNGTNQIESGAAIINLTTGVVDTQSTYGIAKVQAIGSGWWRVDFVYTTTSAYSGANYCVGLVNGAGATSYAGDNTSGAYFWRINQMEQAIFPSSLIQSSGHGQPAFSATPIGSENSYGTGRYPDSSLELSVANAVTTHTGFIEFIEKGSAQIPGKGVWYLGKYDATGARLYIQSGTTGYKILHHNGTTSVNCELSAFPVMGDLVRLRWSLAANGSVQLWQSINAATETTGTTSAGNTISAWGASRVFFNGIGLSNNGFITLRKCFLSSQSLTLTQFLTL